MHTSVLIVPFFMDSAANWSVDSPTCELFPVKISCTYFRAAIHDDKGRV